MQTEIEKVEFYGNGAVVTRTGSPDGDTVTVTGLPRDVDENALHVEAAGGRVVGCRILPEESDNTHSRRCQALRSVWEKAEEAVERNGYLIELYRQNLTIEGGTAGLEQAERYFSERFSVLLAEKTELRRAADAAKKAWERASAQSVEAGKSVSIRLEGNPQALTLRYLTATLGWTPQYEVDADGKSGAAVRLKAEVRNDGGEDLTDMPAVFSQIASNGAIALPRFTPDYIGRRNEARVMMRAAAPMMLCDSVGDVTEEERQVDVTYTLSKITVPSGETAGLTLKEENVSAQYEYLAPSFAARRAYYVADMQKPLETPTVRVFCEGRYLGESAVTDGHILGLGVAERITVNRQEGKRFSEQKVIKGEKTTYSYTVTVRNDRAQPCDIHVVDRVPVSTDKKITVDVTELSGGTLDRETGRIDWTVTVKSGRQVELTVRYSVTDNT